MLLVGKVLVSETILDKKFACQLNACKGACCIQGDAGAPLLEDEIEIINKELENIKPFMSSSGLKLLEKEGFQVLDEEGELGTVCEPTGECVFVVKENGIASCSIELAYLADKTWFKKPLSCHLYPIRAKTYGEYIALNYHHWDICSAACKLGEQEKIPVHRFLKDALTRKFGPSWYNEFDGVAEAWWKEKK